VRFSDLRADLGYSFRLLAIGLPLTTGLGAVAIAAEAGTVHEGVAGMPGLVCFWAPMAILGAVGGILLRTARLRGWSSEEFAGPKLADLRPERAELRERFQGPQLWQIASGRDASVP
jgi:hypothetical protein